MTSASLVSNLKVFNLHRNNDEYFFDSDTKTCADVDVSSMSAESMGENFLVVCLGFLSIFATSAVALLMATNKRLMAHPNKLIFGMCLCEAAAAWHAIIAHMGVKTVICYFDLTDVFIKTNYAWSGSELETLTLLEANNYALLTFLEFFSLSLNFFLCLDIVLTMRSPFEPHGRRFKGYMAGSVLITAVCYMCCIPRKVAHSNGAQYLESRALYGIVFLSAYSMFSIFSVAYAYRINTRPGMSSDIRVSFIRGHLEYVLCYILTWLPYLGLNYFILYSVSRLGSSASL